MDFKLGVDVEPTRDYLNKLSRATITRIRRCTKIKQAALEKLRGNDLQEKKRGFEHLIIVWHFQKRSYSRYVKSLEQFKSATVLRREEVASAHALGQNFFSNWAYSRAKNDLIDGTSSVEEICLSIIERANSLYEIIEAQIALAKVNFNVDRANLKKADVQKMASAVEMSGNDETKLRALISFEISESERLISDLNKCVQVFFKMLGAAKILQIRLSKFLGKIKKGELPDSLRDPEALCDRIKEQMPVLYFIKTVTVFLGIPIGFLVPIESISFIGKITAFGFIGVDQLMDGITSIPAFRQIVNRIKNKINEEEVNQRKYVAEIVVNLKAASADITIV